MPVTRRHGRALGLRNRLLRSALGVTGSLARLLGLAARRFGDFSLMPTRLLDAEPLGLARGIEPTLLVVDLALHLGLLGDHAVRSEEHTSELQSHVNLVCRLLLEKKNESKSIYF